VLNRENTINEKHELASTKTQPEKTTPKKSAQIRQENPLKPAFDRKTLTNRRFQAICLKTRMNTRFQPETRMVACL
jgi:hypothetical protein